MRCRRLFGVYTAKHTLACPRVFQSPKCGLSIVSEDGAESCSLNRIRARAASRNSASTYLTAHRPLVITTATMTCMVCQSTSKAAQYLHVELGCSLLTSHVRRVYYPCARSERARSCIKPSDRLRLSRFRSLQSNHSTRQAMIERSPAYELS